MHRHRSTHDLEPATRASLTSSGQGTEEPKPEYPDHPPPTIVRSDEDEDFRGVRQRGVPSVMISVAILAAAAALAIVLIVIL